MTLWEATVLVVDDEPVLRLTLGLLLQRQGARVVRAGNGQEALEVLRGHPTDLLLTDLRMPVMDGMTMLRTMAAEGIRVPSLLFLQDEPESPEELAALGVVQTITKPIEPEELIQAVADALQPLASRP